MVKEGIILPSAVPEKTGEMGVIEFWDGQLAPGMYSATLAMDRAIAIAKKKGKKSVVDDAKDRLSYEPAWLCKNVACKYLRLIDV